MRTALFVILSVSLAQPAAGQELRLQFFPEIGAEAVTPAGGELYSFVRIRTIDGARLEEDSGPGSLWRGPSISKGTELIPVSTKVAFKACVPIKGTFQASGPCFLDDDGDGKFDRQAIDETTRAGRLKAPILYSRVPVSLFSEDSFKRVFLFQGANSDSLRFSYREFSDSLARAAFTEDISIPREPTPFMMAIKDLQIEVLGVDAMGLRYRILKAN
jgi:hypothetical protein